MNERFEDILDDALARARTEPATAVLDRYPDKAGALAPLLHAAETLTVLRETAVATDPAWQTADRATFLAQMAQLPPAPVSPSPLMRLKGWIRRHITPQKERIQMNTILAKTAVALMLILGISGGTAALATDSMPDSPLYPVKLMMEDTQLAISDGPTTQAELHLAMAQVRVQEMAQIAQTGDDNGAQILTRLQTHLQTALQLAAQTSDTEMVRLLTQMQTMLQAQINTAAQVQTQNGTRTQQMMGELNRILNQYREQAQAGLQDPQLFRWRHGQNPDWEPPCGNGDCQPAGDEHKYGQDGAPGGPNGPGPGNGDCDGDCEPVGDEHKHGQDGVPGGSNGPGPGPGDCDGDCEPVGDEHKHGQDGVPGGSNGPGPGDGDCDGDCEPVGDEHKHGQDPVNSGQNGPGDCDNGDCQPAGDEHKNGQDPVNSGQNGPGDGDCDGDCDPVGDEHKNGQDGDSGSPAGPSDGDGVCDHDCEPAGDQNGPQPGGGSDAGGSGKGG